MKQAWLLAQHSLGWKATVSLQILAGDWFEALHSVFSLQCQISAKPKENHEITGHISTHLTYEHILTQV